jgi:hypothetical protein
MVFVPSKSKIWPIHSGITIHLKSLTPLLVEAWKRKKYRRLGTSQATRNNNRERSG